MRFLLTGDDVYWALSLEMPRELKECSSPVTDADEVTGDEGVDVYEDLSCGFPGRDGSGLGENCCC